MRQLPHKLLIAALLAASTLVLIDAALAQKPKAIKDEDLPYPPTLPGGKTVVTDKSPKFLEPPESLRLSCQTAR